MLSISIGGWRMNGRAIASLGMYDAPSYRAHVDAWWTGLAFHLRAAGMHEVPDSLNRALPLTEIWQSPALLIAQTCGLPLRLNFGSRDPKHQHSGRPVAVLGRPAYQLAHIQAGHYRAAIIARQPGLDVLKSIRPVINDPHSHSGRTALSQFIKKSGHQARLQRPVVSGGHAQSLQYLIDDRADVASIDAVTLALLDRYYPGHRQGLHVLDQSDAVAGLPYITARTADVETIRQAVEAAFDDPTLAENRHALLMTGWVSASFDDYAIHEQSFATSFDVFGDNI